MSHYIYCYAECRYAECCYAERHYAECRYAERRFASRTLHFLPNLQMDPKS